MDKIEGEAEPAVGQRGVCDGERAGREPAGKRDAPAEQLDEIAGAAEHQSTFRSCRIGTRSGVMAWRMFLSANRGPLRRSMRCRIRHVDGQRHADAKTDMLFEAGRAGKALGRVDDLRK